MRLVIHTIFYLPGGEKFWGKSTVSESGVETHLCSPREFVAAALSRRGRTTTKKIRPEEIPDSLWQEIVEADRIATCPEGKAIIERYAQVRQECLEQQPAAAVAQ